MAQHGELTGDSGSDRNPKAHVIWPILWPIGTLGAVAVVVAALWAQTPAGNGGEVNVSVGEIIGGFLLALCTGGVAFLVTSSIKHGNQIAEMRGEFGAKISSAEQAVARVEEDVAGLSEVPVRQVRDAEDIQRLYRETATIDARITDSRHGLRNEIAGMITASELRLNDRMDQRFDSLKDLILGKVNGA